MTPVTQKILLVVLAVFSLGTTSLVLIKGAVENARHDPQFHQHDASHTHPASQHDHANHAHMQHGDAGSTRYTSSDQPDDFGPAPSFNLIDQAGRPVSMDRFEGKAVIASFIFTRCMGPCPLITAQMKTLHDQLKDHPASNRIALVSFSVDPDYDTPAVLADYAGKFQADPKRWTFITGQRAPMWDLITKGFMLALDESPDDRLSPITHSEKLILIDPAGQVRGHYHALSEDSRATMLKHLEMILQSPDTAAATSK